MNFQSYIVTNVLWQIANSLLLYMLVVSIAKKKQIALSAAALFSVNSIFHQPVTWVAAGIGTLPGTFFLLLFFLMESLFV